MMRGYGISSAILATMMCLTLQACTDAQFGNANKVTQQLTAKGNGDSYSGLLFQYTQPTFTCADGSPIISEIGEESGSFVLLRDNCENLSPPQTLPAGQVVLAPNGDSLTYADRVYILDGPPPALSLNTGLLLVIADNSTYQLQASGGVPPYTYGLITNPLPSPGNICTIDAQSGLLTLSENTDDDVSCIVTVTDSQGAIALTWAFGQQPLGTAAPVISPTNTTLAVNGTLQMQATGGTPPYTFNVWGNPSLSTMVIVNGMIEIDASIQQDVSGPACFYGTTGGTATIGADGSLQISSGGTGALLITDLPIFQACSVSPSGLVTASATPGACLVTVMDSTYKMSYAAVNITPTGQ